MENHISELLYKSSPASFAYLASGADFEIPPHIQLIDKALIELVSQGSKILVINMPPRHGKSEFISKYFPAWLLCNFPDKRVILTSYEAHFAQTFGKKVRDIVDEYGSLNDIYLDPASNSVQHFSIENHGGSMSCIGSGGAITGRGADIVIIDDPVKNDAEANSETIREGLKEWFKSTVYTRLEPGGSIILIMTRWHQDDLCGYILNEFGAQDNFIHIDLPALAEENDLLNRNIGEPLWERRFDAQKLKEIENSIGKYWFSALYQQQPAPLGGGIFKKSDFKYYTEKEDSYILQSSIEKIIPKKSLRIFVTVDLAASTKDSADYSVLLTFGITENKEILILDVLRNKFETFNHLKIIEDVYYKWKPVLIGIETVQYQISLFNEVQRLGISVKSIRPISDKISRALPMQAKLNSGIVYFPKYASWLSEFETELLSFPIGKNDDQADCFAYINEIIQPISDALPVGLKHKFR